MALPLLGGCAYVTAVPAPPDSNVQGIRFYEVKPILIVNDQEVKVEMIPNYNRAYALQFGAFLARHRMDIAFERGFVKAMVSDQDSTAVIELAKAIVNKLPDGLGFSGPGTESGASGRFGVYEFVFSDNGDLLYLRPLIHRNDLISLPHVPSAGTSATSTKATTKTTEVKEAEDKKGEQTGAKKEGAFGDIDGPGG
ncbi:MAG TPA: hypothetical protein VIQ05_10710 [Tardiphaga sp.]